MLGGEIHYGRVPKQHWPAILEAAKKLGVEVVGSYVMWDLHERREGEYDFSLLHEFLAEVERRGLRVLARPGPFFYAEWRNLGVPDHAVPFHKLHPEFQRKASRWIAAAMKELRPYLGRLVVAVQADNEIDPMLHYYGEDLGFAEWLRVRYETVERWNAAWGSSYRDFSEAAPSLYPFTEDRRLRDSCQYRYDLATRYARWVVGEYRRNGCSVPVLLNTWPGVDAQNWRDLQAEADLFGIDPYPSNECRGDFRYFRERLRLLRAVAKFPYLAEFGSGVWRGAEAHFSPDHYRLTAYTALASGVRGWNWYMLADRDNWSGAPINERGVADERLAPAFAEAARAFKQLERAPPPEASFAVAWSWRYHQIAQIRKAEADDPLFAVLHGMGIEHDFVDVDRDFEPPRLLLFAGEVEDAGPLWRAVEAGANLVFFQRLTEGCVPPDGTSHPFAERLETSLGFVANGPAFAYRKVPGTPVTARQLPLEVDEDLRRLADLAVGRSYTTGYHEKRGRGSVTVLGCAPSPEAVLALHRRFGIEIPVLPLTPGIHASKRGERIVLLNPGEARTASLRVGKEVRSVEMPRCTGLIL